MRSMIRLLGLVGLLWLPASLLAQDFLAKAQAEKNPTAKIELLYRALETTGPSTDIYWDLGWAHLTLGQYPSALDDFTNGLATERGSVTPASFYAALGYTYYLLSQPTKAIAELDEALRLSPRYTFAMRYRAYSLLALERFAAAEEQLNQHIAVDPEDASGYALRADARQRQGNATAALEDIDKALALKPGEPRYLQRKVLILLDLGREAEIGQLSEDYKAFTSDDPFSYIELARVFEKSGDYSNAIRFYSLSLEQHNKRMMVDQAYRQRTTDLEFHALLGRGYVYFLQEAYGDALADFTRVTQRYPRRWEGFKQLGYLRSAQEDYRAAAAAYERLFELNPTHTEGWVNLGFAYGEINDPGRALATYSRALAVPGVEDRALIFNNRGFIQLETYKQYAAAKADFEQAIATDPTLAMAYVSMGELYQFQNQYEAALPWYEKALSIASRSWRESYSAYLRRATCYRALSNWDDAYANSLQAIRLAPRYGDAYVLMGHILVNQKDYCQALANYRKGIDSIEWFDASRKEEAAKGYQQVQLDHRPECQ